MKSLTAVAALFIGAAFTAAPAFAQAAPQQAAAPAYQPKVSKEAMKAIVDLQTAVQAGKTADLPGKIAAAEAAAKTPDDHYMIGVLRFRAARAANDDGARASAIEEILASGAGGAAQNPDFYIDLGNSYSNLKKYDKAADAYQRVLQLDPANMDVVGALVEARATQGQPAAALAVLQQGIVAQQNSGHKAPESWYKRAVALAYDSKLPQATDLARQWVQAYPSAESWRIAVGVYRNLAKPDTEATLDLLRLLRTVGALTPGDYGLYVESAAAQLNYTEAQAVIDQGLSQKTISASSPELRQVIADLKQAPKATEPGLIAAMTMAKESLPLVHIGDRLAVLGDNSKAADAYRLALTKPGADPSLVNLHIGMALAREGDKAGAAAALKAVSGPLADVAKFWLTYVSMGS